MGSPWPSQAPYEKFHLSDLLKKTAERLPDKTAFVSVDERKYTFGQVWDASRRTARMLQSDDGVKKGETTAILAPNCPEYAVALHGSLLCGAKVTTLNPLYKEREVQHQLDDAEAVVVFVSKLFAPVMDAVKGGLPKVRKVYEIEDLWEVASAHEPSPDPVEIDPGNDIAVLPYSSGTTGLPKGVMLTHHNLTSNIKQMRATGLTDESSVLLCFLPYFHIYGLVVLLNAGLAFGSTSLVMPRFDPDQTLAFIQKYKVTDFFVVPPALLALTHHPALPHADVSSLRFILSGAAPLPPEVGALAAERFGCPMIQGYGMTETSPLANTNPIGASKDNSVGPAVPDTEEKIVDMATRDELPAGEIGELLIRGPQVMKGYWKNPESTAETLIGDGWLRSGDLGYMDGDGYVFIVDRVKEMIKYKGYQVAPAELEGVVMEHPAVLDAAVIPKRDVESGEVPKAFVVLKPDQQAGADEIMEFVAERVAPYKKVRELEFVDAIPKTASGKILRRDLIEAERAKT